MSTYAMGVGQGEGKEAYAGNIQMNRYGIFNGLERPKILDEKHDVDDKGQLHMLGFDPPSSAPTAVSLMDIGEMESLKFVSYKYISLCTRHRRPVPVGDATDAYTRSNPSPVSNAEYLEGGHRACCVTMDYIAREDVSHFGLYRSLHKTTSNEALAGDWYLTVVTTNNSGTWDGRMAVLDVVPDFLLGAYAVETDNYPPNAYAYAEEIDNYVFAGGSHTIGEGLTVTVTAGTWGVTLETAGRRFYDGIRGWKFTIVGDTSGGIDGLGHFYASYVHDTLLQVQDENGNPMAYDGGESGTGKSFWCWLDGDLLRWSKYGEPESWPLNNAVRIRGEITGLAQIPNQSMLLTCSDTPEMRIFDMTSIASPVFKSASLLISSEFTSYHWALCPVEGRIRGIDPWRGSIWECDGSAVTDITTGILLDIWSYLSNQTNKQKNWHACYDPFQKIYAAFVTLATSNRYIDFSIIQNRRTGRWFFNYEKDLLCSAPYKDPNTGRNMVLGGTEGLGTEGGTWGRIFTPGHYNDWIYPNYKTHGTIDSSTGTVLTVDVSDGVLLQTAGDGLKGRWVLATDADGENEQIGLISDNTTATITVNYVYGGNLTTQFSPVPAANWKFYLGLIEVRWGPKRLTFEDPSVMKQIIDFYARMKNADEDDPPFIRLYRGTASTYARQATMSRLQYIDASTTDSWRVKNQPIENTLQWGFSLIDRSYNAIQIEDMSIIFQPEEETG